MLYENEKVRVYNPVVGDYEQVQTKPQPLEEVRIFIEEGNQLAALKQLPGWKQVENFVNESVDYFKVKLINSTDTDQIRRLQEAIKAYLNILHFVDQKINEAKSFDINRTPDDGPIQGE